MLPIVLAFFLGVFLAPAVRPIFRPVLVELIRAGIVLGDEVRRISHTVREGVEDAQAEAAAARGRRPSPEDGTEPASADGQGSNTAGTTSGGREDATDGNGGSPSTGSATGSEAGGGAGSAPDEAPAPKGSSAAT